MTRVPVVRFLSVTTPLALATKKLPFLLLFWGFSHIPKFSLSISLYSLLLLLAIYLLQVKLYRTEVPPIVKSLFPTFNGTSVCSRGCLGLFVMLSCSYLFANRLLCLLSILWCGFSSLSGDYFHHFLFVYFVYSLYLSSYLWRWEHQNRGLTAVSPKIATTFFLVCLVCRLLK